MIKNQKHTFVPWTIAAPSFIWPTTVGENCYCLQDYVQEVSIILFETQACLKYTEKDLPQDLSELGLSYHIHLPLDLPWDCGAKHVMQLVDRLLKKTNYLSPWAYVLHPPQNISDFLEFYELWLKYGYQGKEILLENIQNNDLLEFWSQILETDCKTCLDLGHIIAYEQQHILSYEKLWEKVSMLHAYGVKNTHHHSCLANLSPEGKHTFFHILSHLKKNSVLVFEVFSPSNLKESLDIFFAWIREF